MSEPPQMTTDTAPGEVIQAIEPPKQPRRVRKSVRVAAVLAFAVAGLYYAVTWSAPTYEDWETDFDAAQAKAQATNRNMLLAFHMPGCPPCAVMDRFVLNKRKISHALESYIPVRLNAAANEAAHRYEVYATPTYLITDPAGKVIAGCEGYKSVEEFVAFLGEPSIKKPPE